MDRGKTLKLLPSVEVHNNTSSCCMTTQVKNVLT